MLKGVKCSRGFIPLEDHMQCMLDPGHPCGMSEDMLEMMTGGNKEREDSGVKYSPSSLMSCDRQAILSKDNDWYVDVEGLAWAQTRGNMLHALMEEQPPWPGIVGTVRELRMKYTVPTKYGDQVFMGKADLIVLKSVEDGGILHVKVVDYKTKSEILHGPVNHTTDERIKPGHAAAERKHQMQVNLYAWLVEQTLAEFINGCLGWGGDGDVSMCKELRLNPKILPRITRVVVDEVEIEYADMKKARRFTSATELRTKGKRVSMSPLTYEELVLDPIYRMKPGAIRSWIIKHIEQKIESEQSLPGPLLGESAKIMCFRCPVKGACIEIGLTEGYTMEAQL